MAITRKPVARAVETDAQVEALIRKGGAPANGNGIESRAEIPVKLRLPAGVLAAVDLAVAARAVRVPRHTWLLEAITEKLAREKSRK